MVTFDDAPDHDTSSSGGGDADAEAERVGVAGGDDEERGSSSSSMSRFYTVVEQLVQPLPNTYTGGGSGSSGGSGDSGSGNEGESNGPLATIAQLEALLAFLKVRLPIRSYVTWTRENVRSQTNILLAGTSWSIAPNI